MVFSNKKVLLAITGGIAAYKSILLVRLLIKQGAVVKVVMTPSSKDFVSPLVLATLTGNPVGIELFEGETWANHVMMGRWADIMVVAPCTCNTIAKMANGQCDNLLLALYLSATCPVLLCPAMDEDMWKHPSTKRNLDRLRQDGARVMPVGFGELGSGLTGEGRMSEPEEIVKGIKGVFLYPNSPLRGKQVLVTAGPTFEPIDPVRFIGNFSSGKMGVALANELQLAGAEVTLILGPSHQKPDESIQVIRVQTALQMFEESTSRFSQMDIAFFTAAVADFRPSTIFAQKWKKENGSSLPSLEFLENPDILKYCGANKKDHQTVIGFALESENETENALSKLKTKNADWIVLNSLRDEGATFGGDLNKVTLMNNRGEIYPLPLMSKVELAHEILKVILG